MYEPRAALADTHDLNQGDILSGVLRPATVTEGNFVLRDGGKVRYPAPPKSLENSDPNLRLMHEVRVESRCMVVSNSCDNTLDYPIFLAPIRPFAFPQGCDTPQAQWRVISEAATGTANPKFFYLTEAPEFKLPRSEVQLNLIFTVLHSYLGRCVREAGTVRVCGLKPEAQRHLQWTIAAFFGRNPREDQDWPSREDLKLKVAWLEDQIAAGSRHQSEYKEELTAIKARLGL